LVELKKTLGFWTVFSITITAMIGTGMFFGTAIAASKVGNASILVWVFLGLITVYIGACFGELTSMYPKAGGIYEFSKQAYGKGLLSFLIGWTSWVVINMMNSLLIVAALDYIMPHEIRIVVKIALAILIVVLLNYFAFLGAESVSAILGGFAIIIVLLLLALIGFGFGHIDTVNYTPFFSSPFIMLFVAFFFIVETFFGWENATFMAEETKDAERVIPKALMWASVFVSVLGILLAVVLLGVIPWQILGASSTPVADLSSLIFSPTLEFFIKIGVALALIGSASGGLIGSPRLLLGLARDKLFIEQLADIHPKHQTPYKAIIFQTIVSAIVIIFGFGNYAILLSLLVPLALLMYVFVILAVPILRFKRPVHPRPFKVWFGKSGPIIISIIYITAVVAWLAYTPGSSNVLKLGLSFIFFGIPIFLLLTAYYDPESIKGFNDYFANFGVWMEDFNIPKNFRRELLSYFKDLEAKTILEYGAGIGTLTLHLAESVGPRGKIYATDLSAKNVEILQERLAKRHFTNVEVIYDEHQINRIHPSIKNVDVVFSVGMLSYVQDVHKVLREIYKIMPPHGKICMVEYIDYFWIIPDVKWLSSNEEIEKIFRECGFSVNVTRRRKFFWSYLIIIGIKTDDNVPFI
jgi:amino acid transporter/phospholipid N-methyltransferase